MGKSSAKEKRRNGNEAVANPSKLSAIISIITVFATPITNFVYPQLFSSIGNYLVIFLVISIIFIVLNLCLYKHGKSYIKLKSAALWLSVAFVATIAFPYMLTWGPHEINIEFSEAILYTKSDGNIQGNAREIKVSDKDFQSLYIQRKEDITAVQRHYKIKDGRVQFNHLSKGTYHLTCVPNNYENFETDITISGSHEPKNFHVVLESKNKQKLTLEVSRPNNTPINDGYISIRPLGYDFNQHLLNITVENGVANCKLYYFNIKGLSYIFHSDKLNKPFEETSFISLETNISKATLYIHLEDQPFQDMFSSTSNYSTEIVESSHPCITKVVEWNNIIGPSGNCYQYGRRCSIETNASANDGASYRVHAIVKFSLDLPKDSMKWKCPIIIVFPIENKNSSAEGKLDYTQFSSSDESKKSNEIHLSAGEPSETMAILVPDSDNRNRVTVRADVYLDKNNPFEFAIVYDDGVIDIS